MDVRDLLPNGEPTLIYTPDRPAPCTLRVCVSSSDLAPGLITPTRAIGGTVANVGTAPGGVIWCRRSHTRGCGHQRWVHVRTPAKSGLWALQASRRWLLGFVTGDRQPRVWRGQRWARRVVAGWCIAPVVSTAGLPATWLKISIRRAWAAERWDEKWRLLWMS
jgi:hypothetical protein